MDTSQDTPRDANESAHSDGQGPVAAELRANDLSVVAPMVVHDLREPLQAILSFVSIMLAERVGPINETQRDFLQSVYIATRRMARLIQDVQLVALGDQALDLAPVPVDLDAHLAACCRELEPLAEGYGLEITRSSSGRTGNVVLADPDRIDQIILNLLENALKYAPSGTSIHVCLRQTTRRARILISNQIASERPVNPSEWFRPFSRLGDGQHPHRYGMGLGLSVVAHLVQLLGGRILTRYRDGVVTVGFSWQTQAVSG